MLIGTTDSVAGADGAIGRYITRRRRADRRRGPLPSRHRPALEGGERCFELFASPRPTHILRGRAHSSIMLDTGFPDGGLENIDVFLPTQAIKALSEKLNETRAAFAPKAKFTFKTARKNASAISLTDAAEIASAQRRHIPGYRSDPSSVDSSIVPTPNRGPSPPPGSNNNNNNNNSNVGAANGSSNDGEHNSLKPDTAVIHKPSFSNSNSVTISGHNSVHIILPSSASHATSPGSLTSLKRCVVDLSVPTVSGQPLAGLTLKNIKESLLICGQVNGPAHVTGVENSVIVVACKQFRMHESRNCDVYLQCASRPIIENCHGVTFAPLPKAYVGRSSLYQNDEWRVGWS